MLLVVPWALTGAAYADTRHVLLLTSSESPFAPHSAFSDALRPELIRQSREPIDVVEAAVQTARGDDNASDASVAERLQKTFGSQRLDLVITVGGPAATFAQRFRRQLFPTTPLLVAGVDRRFVHDALLTDRDALVATEHHAAPIIDEIVRLLPDTRTVMVVIGSSPLEQFWLRQLKTDFARFEGRVQFVWTNGMSFAELLDTAHALPSHSAIFFALLAMDANGEPLEAAKALASLHASANAPIFSLYGALGGGIVGGRLQSTEELGRRTVDAALRILRGEPPHTLRTAVEQIGTPTYDWRQLRRWNISEDRLPAGSVIRFREPTMWQQYRTPVLAGAVLAAVPASVAVALVWRVARRRQKMRRAVAVLPDAVAGMPANATVRIWRSDADGQRLETSHSAGAVSADTWTARVHPDDLARCLEVYRHAVERHEPFQIQYRLLRDDGTVQWVLDTGVPKLSDGTFVGYVGSAVDVTRLALDRTELANLTRGLMLAHERERAAVSKKLHDDLCQRMVMLTLRLHHASVAPREENLEDIHRQLSSLAGEILTVADGVARRIEILGLVRVCRTLCEELASEHDAVVHFDHEGAPDGLSVDAALALVRVLREGATNALTHSGEREVWVSLRTTAAGVVLEITDSGIGFDPDSDAPRQGIGLTAIRERISLVNGGWTIESRPGGGTRVRVWAPLRPEHEAATLPA